MFFFIIFFRIARNERAGLSPAAKSYYFADHMQTKIYGCARLLQFP